MDTPMKFSVLFVDDEENVLRGLGRLLRSRRDVWDFRFASSGQSALEMLDQAPADVVVSDMRMPGMNGAELLARVQQKHPETVRIVLSGFAEKEAVLKTIGPSHRYLAKPVAENVLVESIENALRLRTLVSKSSIQRRVAGLSHLPTLPSIYLEILAELDAELGSADRLSAIIEKDIGITAQLLKLTNSAYFNLPQHSTNVKQAINVLGFDNVRATVLLAGVFEQFKTVGSEMISVVDRLAQRSLVIGIIARAIARHERWNPEMADQAFCAGLLAHVGTLVLIANDGNGFKEGMKLVEDGDAPLIDLEEKRFGASHPQLGAYLLGLWGFTDPIVEAVAFHHQPSRFTEKNIDVLTAVHVAQYFAREERGTPRTGRRIAEGLDEAYVRSAALAEKLPVWQRVFESTSEGWPHE